MKLVAQQEVNTELFIFIKFRLKNLILLYYHWATGWIMEVSSPDMGWEFFSLPCPDGTWSLLNLLANGYIRCFFPVGKAAGT